MHSNLGHNTFKRDSVPLIKDVVQQTSQIQDFGEAMKYLDNLAEDDNKVISNNDIDLEEISIKKGISEEE